MFYPVKYNCMRAVASDKLRVWAGLCKEQICHLSCPHSICCCITYRSLQRFPLVWNLSGNTTLPLRLKILIPWFVCCKSWSFSQLMPARSTDPEAELFLFLRIFELISVVLFSPKGAVCLFIFPCFSLEINLYYLQLEEPRELCLNRVRSKKKKKKN